MPLAVNFASAFHPGIERVSQACGDLNIDGNADAADFWIFLAAFGYSVGEPEYEPAADVDADGTVTLVDYQQWLCCYRCWVGNPLAPPPVGTLGDFDADGDIDLADFAQFEGCLNEPSGPSLPCLLKFDFDGNGLIDLADIAAFQVAFTGSQ